MSQSQIHHHQFSNGLVLVAEAMPGVRSAAFSLIFPAGAAYEPADRLGVAGMLSEWIMRGGRRPRQPAVDRRAGQPGRLAQ